MLALLELADEEHHVKHLKSINSFKLIGIHDINDKGGNFN